MSKIALASNVDGTGTLTIAAPNTNSDFTLSLPATTAPILAGSGITLSASAPANTLVTDASGNVGIGTSSPVSADGQTNLEIIGPSGRGNVNLNTTQADGTGVAVGTVAFRGGPSTSAAAEKRIVLITAATEGATANNRGGVLIFNTKANNGDIAERARIDSSGDLLVGTTTSVSSVGRLVTVQAGGGAAGAAISADATNATFTYSIAYFNATRAASSVFDFITCTSGGYSATQFRVRGDGVIFAQNTTVQSISDIRAKENVRDSSDGLSTILGLRPVRFDFKEGFGNNRKNQLGFIAQEVEAVFPDAVDAAGQTDDNGDPYKSVGPGAMIPVLVKAIQELNAKVDAQAAEIAALKGQA
jgi:hypothetical protein